MRVKLAWLVRVGVHAHPLSLLLPSPVKLQCTLQLSRQIHWPYFISTNICTLWLKLRWMGTQRVQMKGVLPFFFVSSLGLSCWYKRFLSRLRCSGRPMQYKILFSSPNTISTSLSPSPCKLGRQPCSVAHLLLCVSIEDTQIRKW